MTRTLLLTLLAGVLGTFALPSSQAQAFCGFYVSGATKKMYNNATQVVMMREGTKTILSMRNNYEGPPEKFAMVIPVPQILQQENVKTLPDALFDKVDQLGAPRLVEYWEQDPCRERHKRYRKSKRSAFGAMEKSVAMADDLMAEEVVVEAQFDVDEYNVVILSATESNALERWLKANGYTIPAGASAAMAPYIAQGQYFFVAKVDPKKVTFKDGQAMLSPLRFHYDSKDFSLPVRLGLLNAKGHQDLIINILAQNQRYDVANHPNITVPTNLIVGEKTRSSFAEFYVSLFDYTLKQNPGAVVTEYAWDASTCDPCPGPTLDYNDLMTLGMDAASQVETRIADVQVEVSVMKADIYKTSEELQRDRANLQQRFEACYQQQLDGGEIASGRVNLKASVERGQIKDVSMGWDSIKDEKLNTCLTSSLQSMSMQTKGTASFEVPVSFSSYSPRSSLSASGWTLTRLHARYTAKELKDDLVFRKAPAIVGGRGMPQGKRGDMAEEGVLTSSYNNFQGRYIILNRWEGKLACASPERGIWGYPPGSYSSKAEPAQDTAFAKRGALKLSKQNKADAKTHYATHKKALK